LRRGLPFASGIALTLIALLVYNAAAPAPRPLTKKDIDTSIANAIASITPAAAYSSYVYQVIRPSLVLIEAHTANASTADDHLGTGFIFNDAGLMLTSLHVVASTSNIQVTFADGTVSPAQVVVQQPENDLAVLRASKLPEKIVPAVLGNPGAMHIGDEAYVVGHPFGLYGSMSAGIISGLNRSFKRSGSQTPLQGLIQVDAAINPGNSGGPLLNRNGEVIGIVTALLNPTEQEVFIGIGFAVTITAAGGAIGAPPL
jgi:S1-C subfamily serine protease